MILRYKNYKVFRYSLLIISIFWFLGFIVFNCYTSSYSLIINTENTMSTGIAVLTGGSNRISKAIELLNQGKGERMLISGVRRGTTLNLITAREDVKLESVLPIDLGYKAKDTVGNAKEIKEWSDKHNINKIYIVTSYYHIPRAKLEIENIVKNKEIKYFPTPSDFVSNKWWKNIKSFKFLALEYTKFLIVFFQYKVLGL